MDQKHGLRRRRSSSRRLQYPQWLDWRRSRQLRAQDELAVRVSLAEQPEAEGNEQVQRPSQERTNKTSKQASQQLRWTTTRAKGQNERARWYLHTNQLIPPSVPFLVDNRDGHSSSFFRSFTSACRPKGILSSRGDLNSPFRNTWPAAAQAGACSTLPSEQGSTGSRMLFSHSWSLSSAIHHRADGCADVQHLQPEAARRYAYARKGR